MTLFLGAAVEVMPILIFLAFVVFVVSATLKQKKAAENARRQAAARRMEEKDSPDTPPKSYDQILAEIRAEKAKKQQTVAALSKPSDNSVFVDDFEEGGYYHPSAAVTADADNTGFYHPAEKTKNKVEYVEYLGSMNGPPTEGCVEHYNRRLVSIDIENEIPSLDDEQLEFFRNVMIYGEIINKPVSRK